jgi:ribosome maturation factor RimP
MVRVSERLQAIIEPAVTALGYELVGVEYLSQGRHSVLRIYIDKEDGVTVDDCARVSHQVSGALDVEDPVKGQYTLEVSSPGLDRPLFTIEHYRRFAGESAEIRLAAPRDGRRKFKGTLRGVEGDTVIIEVEGEAVPLPLDEIEKAHLVHQW